MPIVAAGGGRELGFFYPEARKGTALGVNAAGGNLGVAVAQLLVPSAVAIGAGITIA